MTAALGSMWKHLDSPVYRTSAPRVDVTEFARQEFDVGGIWERSIFLGTLDGVRAQPRQSGMDALTSASLVSGRAISRAQAASLPTADGRLASHLLFRSDVPDYLQHPKWPYTTFHSTIADDLLAAPIDPERASAGSAYGRGFYTSFLPGNGFGSRTFEVATDVRNPLVSNAWSRAETNTLLGAAPTADLRQTMLDNGFDSLIEENPAAAHPLHVTNASGGDRLIDFGPGRSRLVVADTDDMPDLRPASPSNLRLEPSPGGRTAADWDQRGLSA